MRSFFPDIQTSCSPQALSVHFLVLSEMWRGSSGRCSSSSFVRPQLRVILIDERRHTITDRLRELKSSRDLSIRSKMPTHMARPVSSADLRRIDNGTLPPAPSPGGRHADAASGRVALRIGLERQCYVAGQQIRGVLEVHSKTKGLALGDIGIEFGGTEGQSGLLHASQKHFECPVRSFKYPDAPCRSLRRVKTLPGTVSQHRYGRPHTASESAS